MRDCGMRVDHATPRVRVQRLASRITNARIDAARQPTVRNVRRLNRLRRKLDKAGQRPRFVTAQPGTPISQGVTALAR